ncbi:class I histocompatibility antigen, F10 alpha chain isoform X1 [Misgurnus anguillicaudatus]|uniref:class I histocompatibility antigen, F10 alpha chain isoform X1 n=1 Tax=Misgurnus anguillicaudatus TaxID=75329 RepID=UPI003CCF8A63
MDIIVLCSVVLLGAVVPVQSETHSLYYIYTALSKPVNLPGIYDFTAMGLLDDREIDYYNSKEQKKIPKQDWMKEKLPQDYWEKGTQSRKSKEQWFNVNVNILMERMKHNDSDVHVLQWRHGCEIIKEGNAVTFSKGIDEYSYDGENFLSFDDRNSQWVAPMLEAVPTKRKWDNVPILNQYTKGYLEKECVDWLNKFREYGNKELRKSSPPEVHVFAKRATGNKNNLKLTCLATGFYPKDVTLFIRKYRTSLRDNEIESTGVRPNHDGTYQLRKSVEIAEDEKADYDCFVSHITLPEPIITKWDGKCSDCSESMAIGVVIGAVAGIFVCCLAGVGVALYLRKKRRADSQRSNQTDPEVPLVTGNQNNANRPANNSTPNDEENKALINKAPSDSSGNSSLEEVNKCDGGSTGSQERRTPDSGQGSSTESSDSSPASSQEKVNV